jgi:hypothetical protein
VGATRIAEFNEEKLSGTADAGDGEVRARISGTASQREVATLDGFFAALVGAATTGTATTLTIDLRDLHYMNSSHFKLLVSLVGRLKKSGAPVVLRLRTNEAYHWQKRSLPALKHLADDLILLD